MGALVAELDGVELPRTETVLNAVVDVACLFRVIEKREGQARDELRVAVEKLLDGFVRVASCETTATHDVETSGLETMSAQGINA